MTNHYVGHSWYMPTGICHHDGCRCPGAKLAPAHQQPPCWLNYAICIILIDTNIDGLMQEQTMSKRGWEVSNPLVSLLLEGSPTHSDNALLVLPCGWRERCISTRLRIFVKLLLQIIPVSTDHMLFLISDKKIWWYKLTIIALTELLVYIQQYLYNYNNIIAATAISMCWRQHICNNSNITSLTAIDH